MSAKKVTSVEIVLEGGERIHLPEDAVGAHYKFMESKGDGDKEYTVIHEVIWTTKRPDSIRKRVK